MSWSIALLENSVAISKDVAQEIFLTDGHGGEHNWASPDDVCDRGKLYFNPDDDEHMDFMWDEKIIEVLKKYKVEGRICFGSLEGDNRGEFWGYEFDGKGNMEKLKGYVAWEVQL